VYSPRTTAIYNKQKFYKYSAKTLNGSIRFKSILFTNKKSQVGFHLVSKSVTGGSWTEWVQSPNMTRSTLHSSLALSFLCTQKGLPSKKNLLVATKNLANNPPYLGNGAWNSHRSMARRLFIGTEIFDLELPWTVELRNGRYSTEFGTFGTTYVSGLTHTACACNKKCSPKNPALGSVWLKVHLSDTKKQLRCCFNK